MQKAETVLSILKQKSKQDESHRYDRIYRNLFNEDFFLRAYQKIHAKQGNMTPGTDGTTIDGFSRKQISQLIELLKWERYQPKPVRRTYIPKKNGKMRPLGIPAFADKLVQEVVRQILEAIYEPIFSDNSHGFRPNRSCHTALYQIKSNCRGTNWVIEGDITGCFDHIDHEILLKILSKKIDDGRFLELIRNSTRSTIRCREHRRAASSAPFWPTFICTSLISSWKEYLLNTPKGNSGDHIVNIRFSNTNETVQKRKAIRNKRMSTCGKCRISLP